MGDLTLNSTSTNGPSLIPSLQSDLSGLSNSVSNTILGTLATVDSAQSRVLPWQDLTSKFFHYIDLDPQRWDQLFPYRLMVIDSNTNQGVNGGGSVGPSNFSITVTKGTGSSIIDFQTLGQQWIFNLPISPQQLSITDQYAINTTATLRGILEEHSGIKFKIINATGTMGVWPYRQSITTPPTSPNILQSLFGGTIAAAQNLLTQVNTVINAATTGHPANKPTSKRPTGVQFFGTGYYQALALQQFLEQYSEAKKDPANASWRLVFDIPKQNQSFVVTPIQYVWQQSVNEPMKFNYTFQLKAWRRIDLHQNVTEVEANNQSISPGILQRILNTITAAQNTASSALALIGAVQSDVTAPLAILTQTSLLVKDLAGVAIAVSDLPSQVITAYSSAIAQAITTIQQAIASVTSSPATAAALAAVVAGTIAAEGVSTAAVASGQLGTPAILAETINPAAAILSNPNANFGLLSQVPLSVVTLTDAQQAQVDQIIANVRQTTVDDLVQYKAAITKLTLALANSFGAGDPYFNKIYGLPPPTVRSLPMTLDEYDILKQFYEVIQAYDILTATEYIDDLNIQSNMDYVAGLADQSDIDFNIPNSKFLAPVPFGMSVEQIALRYLGDVQRWLEIVTLNNLREPYIDETGFTLSLLSNATGRQITIADITNLYIGQTVILKSTTQIPAPRTILGIDQLSSTSFLITLDGLPNLDNFVIADSAYIQAYLPGTVNSQQKIFIPSTATPPDDPNIIIPADAQTDPLSGLSKVDLLLTDSGDLAVDNYGDFKISYGTTNIVQALRIKFGTVKGTVITHPNFGLGIKPGTINSEVSTQDIFNSINRLLQEDPRFQGISSLQVTLSGPTLSISAGVNISGKSGIFPVNFNLQS